MSMVENPLISVIVPVYNVELYIDACLDSIKQQTYENLEIIVVEDCSTDNSKKILQPHLEDKRIKLLQHEKNSGLSAARNSGIEAATGDFMMFVDSDDLIDIRLVESCVNCALKNDAELVTYGFTSFEDGLGNKELPYPGPNIELMPTIADDEYYSFPHFAWLKFIRSSVVRSSKLHFPVGLYYEDWPFHWHLGLSTKKRYQLPISFYLYRQRATSITGSTNKKLLDLFVIHSLVMSLIQNYKAHEIKNLLANKIRQSHWSVLTRIDSDLLVVALEKAKNANKTMRLNGYRSDFSLRNLIIPLIVSTPNRVSLSTLKILRNALHKKRELKKR